MEMRWLCALVLVTCGCDPIVESTGRAAPAPALVATARGHHLYVQALRFPEAGAHGLPVSSYHDDELALRTFDGDPVAFQFRDLGRHDWALLAWVDVDDSSALPGAPQVPTPGDLYGVARFTTPHVPSPLEIEIDGVVH